MKRNLFDATFRKRRNARQRSSTNSRLNTIPRLEPLESRLLLATSATKADTLLVDNNGDGAANPGDTLRYTVLIENEGDQDALDVMFADTLDPNTTLVPGSINVAPLAMDDAYNTADTIFFQGQNLLAGGSSLTIDDPADGLFANDREFLGDSFTLSTFDDTSENGGAVNVNPDGTFTYEAPANFTGTDIFTYTISDSTGQTDAATISINVDNTILTSGGQPISILHVSDSGIAGNGSFENPHGSLVDADVDPNKGDANIIYLHADSIFAEQGFSLSPNQRLLGEGDGNDHLVETDQLGQISMPASNGGGNRPVIENPGSNRALAAADNSEISNVSIVNSGVGILLNGLAGDVNVNRTDISPQDTAGDGIEILGGTGTFTFTDVSVETAAIGILLDGGASNVIFGSENVEPSAGLFGPSTVNQTVPLLVTNNHAGSFQLPMGSSIGGPNALLNFGNADGTYTFDGTVTLDQSTPNAGIDIAQSNGVFTFSDTTITDPIGSAVVVEGGNANVNFLGGSISNGGDTSTISVGNGHAGTLNFGVDITSSGGNGLQFDGASGTYNFSGATSLSGNDAGIDILGSSSGTFTFSSLEVANSASPGISLMDSGGSVTVGTTSITDAAAPGVVLDNWNGTFSVGSGLIGTSAENGVVVGADGDAETCVQLSGLTINSGGVNIQLDQAGDSDLGISQPSLATLAADNNGATVASTGTIGFTCLSSRRGLAAKADLGEEVVESESVIAPVSFGPAIDLGTLPVGERFVITFDVTINDPFPADVDQVVNQGTVTGGNFNPLQTYDPAVGVPDIPTITLVDAPSATPSAVADLSVTKMDSADPIVAGGMLIYTLTVENAGPDDAENVVVADTLPPGVTFVSTTGCINETNPFVTCALGNIPAGGTARATVTVTVDEATTGVITNAVGVAATAVDPNPENNSAVEETTVNPPATATADLSVTKTDQQDPVVAGGTLTYTVTVDNAGPDDAENVVVADTLPAGVTFASVSGCLNDPGPFVTCSLGEIPAGGSAQFTVTVNVNASTTGVISNAVGVASNALDPNPEDNSALEETTVNPPTENRADLSIAKIDNVDPVGTGGTIVYAVTVNNAGPDAARNVTVTETLPPGVTFRLSTVGCQQDPLGIPVCTLGDIPAGGSALFTITATIDDASSGLIVNQVAVASETTDPNPDNNVATQETTIEEMEAPEIEVVLTADPNAVAEPGADVVYSVSVTNTSSAVDPVAITSLTDDALGDLFGQGDCAAPDTLVPGATFTCSYTAPAAGNAGAALVNTVTVTAEDDEGVVVDGQGSVTVTVTDALPAISVTKIASPAVLVAPGGAVSFTVRVENNSAATDPVTLDSLVDDVHGDLNGQGTCVAPQTIAAGDSFTCTFNAPVTGQVGDSVTNTVTVAASDDEGNQVSETAAATVSIQEAVPTTDEILVNTTLTSRQIEPSVDAHSSFFVVVWSSFLQDGSGWGVFGQRFDLLGQQLGDEFLVNQTTQASQIPAHVDVAADGSFVVTWSGQRIDGTWDTFARLFHADGAAASDELSINQNAVGLRPRMPRPEAAFLANGSFAISWEGVDPPPSRTPISVPHDIFVRTFDATGTPLIDESRILSATTGDQSNASIAATPEGGFAVAFQSEQALSGDEILVQRFDANAQPSGEPTTVNSRSGFHREPSLDVHPTGQVVVSWSAGSQRTGMEWDVLAQQVNVAGQLQGPEIVVNQHTAGLQHRSSVAVVGNGGFVVGWEGAGSDDVYGIRTRTYASDGQPTGDSQLINLTTMGIQRNADMAAVPTGYIMAWDGWVAEDGMGVSARVVQADPPPRRGFALPLRQKAALNRIREHASDPQATSVDQLMTRLANVRAQARQWRDNDEMPIRNADDSVEVERMDAVYAHLELLGTLRDRFID